MAFDGQSWDETTPTNTSAAHQIDDHMQDVKKGVSGRMALEHIYPSSQTATAEGGRHVYVTFRPQGAAPSLPLVGTTTQNLAIYTTTTHDAIVIDSAGSSFTIFKSARGLVLADGTSTQGDIWFSSTAGKVNVLAASKTGYSLVTQSAGANPKFAPVAIQGWVNMTGSATADILAGYNVTSVARTSTGLYSVVWSSQFADTKYAVVAMAVGLDAAVRVTLLSAASANIRVYNTAGATVDATGINIMALGT